MTSKYGTLKTWYLSNMNSHCEHLGTFTNNEMFQWQEFGISTLRAPSEERELRQEFATYRNADAPGLLGYYADQLGGRGAP